MTYGIRREEFLVLAYLHECAEGFEPDYAIDLEAIAEATSLQEREVLKAVSYLSGLGFVGLAPPPGGYTLANEAKRYVFLQSYGEEFMRRLEDQLYEVLANAPVEDGGKVTTITMKVGGFVYDTAKAIVVKVLADWMTGK